MSLLPGCLARIAEYSSTFHKIPCISPTRRDIEDISPVPILRRWIVRPARAPCTVHLEGNGDAADADATLRRISFVRSGVQDEWTYDDTVRARDGAGAARGARADTYNRDGAASEAEKNVDVLENDADEPEESGARIGVSLDINISVRERF